MCGIAGIVDLEAAPAAPSREALTRMVRALGHRGPDEFGLYRDRHAGLGHARLSIIDIATGQQPLAGAGSGTWIVFNGEIFNYVELRAELERSGHHFRTASDTEVIVQAYDAWGDAAFARMNGQWALALWDPRKKRLVLSRDRLGVRPLYLCRRRERLYFASEVKAIFAADAAIPRAFDPAGLDETLTFWSVVPPQSVFAGIEELRPGTVRTYENGTVREIEYWTPRYPEAPGESGEFRGSLDEAIDRVRAALEEATRLRMVRADVPVGSYLSGGLDSALTAALGQRYARGRFQTFSLRFEDAEYDETPYQRLMAERLGATHHELVVTRNDIARAFPDVIFHTERPILRTAPAPLYLLSRLTRDAGIKVVLTGEGADEMFAGYDIFREGKIRRYWAKAPQSSRRSRLLERLYPYLARSPVAQQAMTQRFFGRDLEAWRTPGFAHRTRWQTTAALKRMLSGAMREAIVTRDTVAAFISTLPPEFPRWSPLAQDQCIECRTLLSGYLLSSQGDRMLMAHSIEGRFPFLDANVVELANALPARYKLRVLDEKHVLKRVALPLVGERIARRKKQPYRSPDAASFVATTGADYVEAMLEPRAVSEAGVFEPAAVAQLWRKCKANADGAAFSNTDNMALVAVLSTQLLHEQLVRERAVSRTPIHFGTDVDCLGEAAA